LLRSKIDENKIDEFGKISSAETKTRGVNPCEDDHDYLVMLFKSLKTNYFAFVMVLQIILLFLEFFLQYIQL
jgi:hypothetical protein